MNSKYQLSFFGINFLGKTGMKRAFKYFCMSFLKYLVNSLNNVGA